MKPETKSFKHEMPSHDFERISYVFDLRNSFEECNNDAQAAGQNHIVGIEPTKMFVDEVIQLIETCEELIYRWEYLKTLYRYGIYVWADFFNNPDSELISVLRSIRKPKSYNIFQNERVDIDELFEIETIALMKDYAPFLERLKGIVEGIFSVLKYVNEEKLKFQFKPNEGNFLINLHEHYICICSESNWFDTIKDGVLPSDNFDNEFSSDDIEKFGSKDISEVFDNDDITEV